MPLNIVINQIGKTGPRIGPDKVRLYEFLVQTVAGYDIPVTTRHLFYRVTSAGLLPKTEASYQAVTIAILKLRKSGDIDWKDITDGTRMKVKWVGYSTLAEAAEEWQQSYRRNIWAENPVVPEVWTESRGLLGTINTIAGEYGVTTFGMGGYNSATLGWETARDIVERAARGQKTLIVHVGDYDPSGLDLARSAEQTIKERLIETFGWDEDDCDDWFTFDSIALTDAQVRQYKLPSAPPKAKDNRTARFVADAKKAGRVTQSVELDALDPRVLQDLVRTAIESVLDAEVYRRAQAAEEAEKEALKAFSEGLAKVGLGAIPDYPADNDGAQLWVPK